MDFQPAYYEYHVKQEINGVRYVSVTDDGGNLAADFLPYTEAYAKYGDTSWEQVE
jgi:hypothetical protein